MISLRGFLGAQGLLISVCSILQCIKSFKYLLFSHWFVIEHRTRKQDIEVGKYTAQNLENMADLHGES